jgi:hypothetical protein
MRQLPASPSARLRRKAFVLTLFGIAVLLSGCETDGATPNPLAALTSPAGKKDEAAKPAEPPPKPMTHTQAAEECWMATEKGYSGATLDKRADIVDKCIADKMKKAEAPPRS